MSIAVSSPHAYVYDTFYIGGQWVRPDGSGMIDVINSTTEEVMGRVPEGNATDIHAAVAAAAVAFQTWSQTTPAERAAYLQQIADALAERRQEIATVIANEVGMPMPLSVAIQASMPINTFSQYAQMLHTYPFEEQVGNSLVVQEPIGVVGCITPWNFPLHQVAGKVAPALAAGCTVILKPSEVAPITAFLLAAIVHDIGVPAGVFNLVTGFGPVVGEALASHPDVDMVSFTGSTRAGKRVSELAAQTVKRVTLELGGKSASIVLDDADLPTAVSASVNNCYLNSGQTCSAHTRLLVPRARHDEAAALAKTVAEHL